ncbi:hypothetical protein K1X76_06995 [bacterium]|nr:hypothetical protein [bacterium]
MSTTSISHLLANRNGKPVEQPASDATPNRVLVTTTVGADTLGVQKFDPSLASFQPGAVAGLGLRYERLMRRHGLLGIELRFQGTFHQDHLEVENSHFFGNVSGNVLVPVGGEFNHGQNRFQGFFGVGLMYGAGKLEIEHPSITTTAIALDHDLSAVDTLLGNIQPQALPQSVIGLEYAQNIKTSSPHLALRFAVAATLTTIMAKSGYSGYVGDDSWGMAVMEGRRGLLQGALTFGLQVGRQFADKP